MFVLYFRLSPLATDVKSFIRKAVFVLNRGDAILSEFSAIPATDWDNEGAAGESLGTFISRGMSEQGKDGGLDKAKVKKSAKGENFLGHISMH